jgi:hypothetical protein
MLILLLFLNMNDVESDEDDVKVELVRVVESI